MHFTWNVKCDKQKRMFFNDIISHISVLLYVDYVTVDLHKCTMDMFEQNKTN